MCVEEKEGYNWHQEEFADLDVRIGELEVIGDHFGIVRPVVNFIMLFSLLLTQECFYPSLIIGG